MIIKVHVMNFFFVRASITILTVVVNQTCDIQYGGKNLSNGENLSTTTDEVQAQNAVKVAIRICSTILCRSIDLECF